MKLYPPFGNMKHWMSQTRHGENASNPADISKQIAEDWETADGTGVYSGCDGRIVNVSPYAGTYLTLDPGPSCPFWILYVHCKAVVANGTSVRRGQQIAVTIAPYGHLHLAMKNKNYQPLHPEPMDYWDRNVPIDTRYQEIKNEWFINGGKNFNWGLFRDLHIPGTVISSEKTCEQKLNECLAHADDLQKHAVACSEENALLTRENSRLNNQAELLKTDNTKLQKEIEKIKGDLLNSADDIHVLQKNLDMARSSYDLLFDKHEKAKSDTRLCREKYGKDTEMLKTDVRVLEEQLKKCKNGKVVVDELDICELLSLVLKKLKSRLGKLYRQSPES